MTTTDQPYAECTDCSETFVDRAAMDAHLEATCVPGGSSHKARIVHPTLAELARSRVLSAVWSALDDCMTKLDRLVRRGELTEDDVTKALHSHPDFADEWADWLEENR